MAGNRTGHTAKYLLEPGLWLARRSRGIGAGRILGHAAYVEQYGVDGTPLAERYPVLEYVLG